jgi:hypothetical protein
MRNLLVRILKKAIQIVEKKEQIVFVKEETILQNVFNSDFEKKALISYLKKPFLEELKYDHTNYLECYTAAEVFHELGYSVDVIDLMEEKFQINYSDYKVIYGLGFALENAFLSENAEQIIKIFYSTGYNPFFSYKASLLQVQNFHFKNKKLIPQSSRVQSLFWAQQYILSDLVIALGNNLVAKSYVDTNPKINVVPVPAFYFDIYDINIDKKNFENSKKHFLWFGSSGLLHKGLDILIDIFEKRKDIYLHICGADKNEKKFWEFYNPILRRCDNISEYGFISLQSDKFKELMGQCAFSIFPSASEGGSPALLNVMANGGLIPIATKTIGVDIFDLGYEIEDLSESCILREIEKAMLLNPVLLKEKAINVKSIVRNSYTYAKYKSALKNVISKQLEKV